MAKKTVTSDMFKIASFDDDVALPTVPSVPVRPMAATVSKKVAPELLLDNPLNRFSMIEDEDYEALLAGIEKDGFKTALAIEVKPADENGNYMILSGHRRKKAAIEKGIKIVPIVVNNAAAEWSVLEEIGYLTRANDGTRQKNAYSCAAMSKLLYDELRKQGIVEKIQLLEASMKYFGVKQTTQYYYMQLSLLPDKVIEWGVYGLLTRDEGLNLVKVYEEQREKAQAMIALLDEAYESNATLEARRKAFAAILSGAAVPKKKDPKKPEEKFDVLKTFRKSNKILQGFWDKERKMPRKKENIEELAKLCDEMEEQIKQIRSELNI